MSNIILFDDSSRDNLLPLTFTRPIAALRIGILTIKEKWEKELEGNYSYLTEDYLSKKFPSNYAANNLYINGGICPNQDLINEIGNLTTEEALVNGETIIAILTEKQITSLKEINWKGNKKESSTDYLKVDYPWDIFSKNGEAIEADFKVLTDGRTSAPISDTNIIIGKENIFVEEGATIEASTLNGKTGPIYIGKDAEVMEGSVVRGPLALCDHGVLKLATKIYGPTTVGPHSKVGGEVNNSVIIGYSNKGHDGFIGNTVIGEWCNLGADTNTSNLKNNYANVRLWNYPSGRFADTGLQFCGLIMGDHSKCGINTMFNTGTVVGVNANIFGSGFPRNFIPSYSWGGASGQTTYKLNKVFEVAEIVMSRRGVQLDDQEKEILEHISEQTQQYRVWENKD